MAENKRQKGKWSKEAKERYKTMMKEKYGVNRDPSPSIIKEREFKEHPVYVDLDKAGLRMFEGAEKEEMKTDRYISKRSFDYDSGIKFEHGQIVELRGLPNDEKLLRLGYVLPYSKDGTEQECIQCGKSFGSTSGYVMHTASHYEKCGICNRNVAPEDALKHQEAHAVLA